MKNLDPNSLQHILKIERSFKIDALKGDYNDAFRKLFVNFKELENLKNTRQSGNRSKPT